MVHGEGRGVSHPRDLISDRCVVCGRAAEANHHEPPKGMGGRKDEPPRLTLCGRGNEDARKCHGARHQGHLTLTDDGETWRWEADAWYAAHLRSLGMQTNGRGECRAIEWCEV